MKILFLTSSMEGGGAERVAASLSNAWTARGHQLVLMPTFSAGGECAYRLAEGVQLEFLSDHAGRQASRLARLRILRRFIGSFRPDVIVSFLPHVNVAAILAATGLGIPVIACERTYPPRCAPPLPSSLRLMRWLIYPRAAALVGQTELTADWLRRRAGRAHVAVIANPVELPLPVGEPRLAPEGLVSPERRLILWVGRIDEEKRPRLLIDAFARIASNTPDWDVVMLGDGPSRAEMVKRVAACGLAERILLPGFAGNVGDWYSRAELYVMTSSFEGFPNTLLEAMAYGLPSVAFNVLTGPRELSDRGRRLMLLPDDNRVDRLADALARLSKEDTLRKSFAGAALEVRTVYSQSSILAQWDRLFARVTGSAPPLETEL